MTPLRALYVLLIAVACLGAIAFVDHAIKRATAVESSVDVHQVSLDRLDARLRRLEMRPAARPVDLDGITAQLDACGDRTDHLRFVLEALLPVWPGRAALPTPPEGWPAWPEPASAIGSAMPVMRGATEAELAAMRRDWRRHVDVAAPVSDWGSR